MTGKKGKITKDMTFAQVLQECPDAIEVFASFRLFCAGCPMASRETIEQGCQAHGMDAEEVVKKLNQRCR